MCRLTFVLIHKQHNTSLLVIILRQKQNKQHRQVRLFFPIGQIVTLNIGINSEFHTWYITKPHLLLCNSGVRPEGRDRLRNKSGCIEEMEQRRTMATREYGESVKL